MTHKKSRIGYLILCVLGFVIFAGYIITGFIKAASNSVSGIYQLIYLAYILPCFTIVYGVFSYILTKQVIIPNLVFAVAFSVFMSFFGGNSNFFEELVESILLVVIIFAVSTVSSFMVKFVSRLIVKNKKSK